MTKVWWKEAIAYQIYPRSFMDSNGDGIGDIKGITTKLDYLKGLGIDVIWVCPMYTSPNDDNGYDISDYQNIMDDFGTMDDFNQLLEQVHKRGMKLILDLVINHTSDEHPWFIESRLDKNSPKRDWYIWKDGNDGMEPNNWESIFNGSAWKYDEKTKQYFMHIFSAKQPDLNWENPEVRNALYQMVNWWLDKGIDGFRVDAISHIKKTPGFPDMPNSEEKDYVPCFDHMMNVDGIDSFLSELRDKTFHQYDIMTVGEANGVKVDDADKWVGEDDGYFNMIFQFEHLGLWDKGMDDGVDVKQLKQVLTKWQDGLEGRGWNALFLENHDQPRSINSWGNSNHYWKESGKMLGTLYFLMKGTPFIYQGQEIGMTNVRFPSIEDYNDVSMKNYYMIEREKGRSHQDIMNIIWCNGRDNSRTPMQWNDSKMAGFTTGEETWFGVNPNYVDINVKEQRSDPDSILNFYKKMILIRKEHDVFVYGAYQLVCENHPELFVYLRSYEGRSAIVICNFSEGQNDLVLSKELAFSKSTLLLSNYQIVTNELTNQTRLMPYEARVYLLEN